MVLIDIFISFFKIGLFSFGGGLAMLPLIQNEVVFRHTWMSQELFLNTIAIAEVTPGPIALNAATFSGYNAAGITGGLVATIGVVMPSFFICLMLSVFIEKVKTNLTYKSIITYVRVVVIALILSTAVILWPESVTDFMGVILFAGSFFLFYSEKFHPVLILLLSGILGLVLF